MKKIILAFAFTLFLSVTAFAQTAADVTGKWFIKGMPQMDKLDAAQKKKITDAFKDCIFIFGKDKKYSINMMGQKDNGTWKMKGKGIEVTSSTDKKPTVLQIIKLDKTEMRLNLEGQVIIFGRIVTK